jgi:hypothetical protein
MLRDSPSSAKDSITLSTAKGTFWSLCQQVGAASFGLNDVCTSDKLPLFLAKANPVESVLKRPSLSINVHKLFEGLAWLW